MTISSLSTTLQQLLTTPTNTPLPIEQWNPTVCGSMDLTIKANGEWWHEGQKIQRPALIQLFSRVLWLEDGQYYLKTPVEKIQIQVEDAPFLIEDVEQITQQQHTYLLFRTNVQEQILLDKQHPIFMRQFKGEWRPYLHIRLGLNALIQRSVFYHLLQFGELQETPQGDTILKIVSGEQLFELSTPHSPE